MFGLKIFAKSKTKKFATDKDRRKYYAIQGYYKNKNNGAERNSKNKKDNAPR